MAQEERARRRSERESAAQERLRHRVPLPGKRAAALVGVIAVASAALWAWRSTPHDPSRFGPTRFLTLGSFSVEREAASTRLKGSGETNLPDGCSIHLRVRTTEDLVSFYVPCVGGHFSVAASSSRLVTRGEYRLQASFKLEEQKRELRELLHYQPASLSAESTLLVANGPEPGPVRQDLRALVAAANNAAGRGALVECHSQASRLTEGLWFSTLLPAATRLDQCLAQALKDDQIDFDRLRRDLVEVEVLSGR